MNKLIFLLSLLILPTLMSAQTPFTLTGVKKLSVLAEDYSGLKLKESLLKSMREMMSKSLKELGVTVEKYNNNILGLIIKSQKVQNIQLVTLNMVLAGQVLREGAKESVFGFTYQISDTIEVNELENDLLDSLEFLLGEFSEQYIEDQKE